MSDVAGVIGALATLTAGVTGLLKVIELWRHAQSNYPRESKRNQQLQRELAMKQRALDICYETNDAFKQMQRRIG
ncbi:MAG TPA: hypothetical protein VK600_01270 [Candidatus Saccharimonadales bacterium]|nr:hypothetical protein [Candidatus Saccharimonadales bacterium]